MAQPDSDETRLRTAFSRRTVLLGLGQAGLLGILGARLYQLQVTDASRFAPLADDNRINTLALAPLRGRIFDRFGVLLAGNDEAFRVTLVPALASDVGGTLDRLAQIVPLPADERAKVIARARRQPPTLPIVVAQDLTWEQVARVNLHAPELPGIEAETYGRRRYYHSSTVGHVVGHVGAIERIGLGDDPMLRIPGMRIGRAGVERGMDGRLRGTGGAIRREVDARGRIVRNLMRTDPRPGDDVVLTLDLDLQARVVKRLAEEKRGAAVVLDVNGGEIVAMASVPGYDPALLTQQAPPRIAVRARSRRLPRRGDDPLVNRATNGLYPPGSTFKIVTALAALEAGVVDARERIECDGSYEYYDRTFRCWKRSGHGRCDLHRAIRESCDCYHYEIARRVGMERIAAMAVRLGCGQIYAAGIAPQRAGIVPTPGWKRGRFGKGWLGGETLLASIGQGYVLTTPLQLAVMTARTATGRLVMPTLIRPDAGRPPQFAALGVAERHLVAMRRALRAVVNEDGGTGSKASPGDGSIEVAGKTGTSQVTSRSADRAQDDLAWDERDHALFVGYFPVHAPRYAIAAVVEHGGGGGATAAPLVRDIIEELIQRDPLLRPAYSAPAEGRAPALLARGREG